MKTKQDKTEDLPQETPSTQEVMAQETEAEQPETPEASSTETPEAASQAYETQEPSPTKTKEEVPITKEETTNLQTPKPSESSGVQTGKASPSHSPSPSQPPSPAQPTSLAQPPSQAEPTLLAQPTLQSLPSHLPKAFVMPRLNTATMSYRERAGLYLRDKNEYMQIIGGEKQWK